MATLIDPKKDWFKIKIGEVELLLSPLAYGQKLDASSCTKMDGGVKVVDMAEFTFRMIKYSIKGIDGVTMSNGSKYDLEFESKSFGTPRGSQIELEVLTDDCAELLLTGLNINPGLQTISYQILNEIPDNIVDSSGNIVEGVEIKIVGKPCRAGNEAK